MPSGAYTTDNKLIPSIKRTAHIPAANNTFQASDLCAMADEELQTSLLSQILGVRESYYLTSTDQASNATGIYPIPYRAIGGRVHSVQILSGSSIYTLARVEPKDLTNTLTPPTNTYGFWLQDGLIYTLPILSGVTIRVYFYYCPSMLIAQASAAQVTSIASTSVVVSAVPSAFANGSVIDFTQDQPPFNLLAYDQAITTISGTTINFAANTIPSRLAVGDWIALAGYSPVPQLPKEFQPLLAQRVVVKVLESQGYLPKMDKAQAKLQEMERAVGLIINPRAEGNPKIITPNRSLVRPGPGRRGGSWFVTP